MGATFPETHWSIRQPSHGECGAHGPIAYGHVLLSGRASCGAVRDSPHSLPAR